MNLAAIKENGYYLKNAPKWIRDNKETVLTAVKDHGNNLEYASDRLRDDKEIVFAAVKQNADSYLFASDGLAADSKLMICTEFESEKIPYGLDCETTLKEVRNFCLSSLTSDQVSMVSDLSDIIIEMENSEFKTITISKICLDIRKNGKVDEGTLNKLEQMKPYYQVMGGASGSVTVK